MNDLERLKLLIRCGVATERHLEEAGPDLVRAAKTEDGAVQLSVTDSDAELVSEERRVLRFIWSTEVVNRQGDIVRSSGWDTSSFARNPIALYQHDSYAPLGTSPLFGVNAAAKNLWGDIAFAPAGTSPEIDARWKLAKAGVLRAVSVGFMPLTWEDPQGEDRKKLGLGRFGVVYTKQELLEISLVSIPANPEALRLSVKHAIDAGQIDDREADAFMRSTVETERDLFRRLSGLAAKRTSAPRPELPWERVTEQMEHLAAGQARLERAVAALGERVDAAAAAKVQCSEAGSGWDAGQLLDLIDRRAQRLKGQAL